MARVPVLHADARQVLPEEGICAAMSKTECVPPAKRKRVKFVAWVTDPKTGKRRYASWYGLKGFPIAMDE
jgi:hypothetical protein